MKTFKIFLLSFFIAFSTLFSPIFSNPPACAQSQESVYVGSSRSDKYHYPSCVWAKRINPENLVDFSSEADAAEKGYVACKVCRP